MEQQKIGLVAGRGSLPFEAATEIRNRGLTPVIVGLEGETDNALSKEADFYCNLPVGQLERIISTFQSQGVSEVVFAGKVGKQALFSGQFDLRFQSLLTKLPQKNDDAILLAIVEEFQRGGITVAKQTDYLANLLAPVGVIFGAVTPLEMADITLGFRMAKAMGDLDIGQSVVVKQGVVLAVEAIEGTDQAIIRGGGLGGPGAVVVKVSKPKQDERFDVPTVGRTTIESMCQVQAKVLAVEANKTLIVGKDLLLPLLNKHQITLFAV